MKSAIGNSILSGAVFFGTVVILSIGYWAFTSGLTTGDKTSSGSILSSSSWNRIIDSFVELDGRTTNISSSGTHTGIGKAPDTRLDVNGELIRSVFYYEPGAISNVAFPADTWSVIWWGWTFNYTKKSALSKLLITTNTVARWNYNNSSGGWWLLGFIINGTTYDFWWNYTNTVDMHTPWMYRRAISGLPKGIITLQWAVYQSSWATWVSLGCNWVPNITIEEIY